MSSVNISLNTVCEKGLAESEPSETPRHEGVFRLLVGDDELKDWIDDNMRDTLQKQLSPILKDLPAYKDVEIVLVDNPGELRTLLKETVWGFVGLDNKWNDRETFGIEIARELRSDTQCTNHAVPMVVFTQHSWLDRPELFDSLFAENVGELYIDFFPKPSFAFHTDSENWLKNFTTNLLAAMKACFRLWKVQKERDAFRQQTADLLRVDNIIAESAAMKKVVSTAEKVASADSTVLLLGESGTGKEVVAQRIHYGGSRKDRPLIELNVAAFPESLLESELFGHEKGAFTGAGARRLGKLELAGDGTLFLDEIGEMPLHMQAKLLRVLEDRKFHRVGGNDNVSFEARLIAATNRDLENAVKEGRFRRDLYYRLNVIPIEIPPLRKRKEDIIPLAERFLNHFASKLNKTFGLAEDAKKALRDYRWPGNGREVRNVMEHLAVLLVDSELTKDDLPPEIRGLTAESTIQSDLDAFPFDGTVDVRAYCFDSFESKLIERAMEMRNGNQTKAAAMLGIQPSVLHSRLKKLKER